MGGWAGRAGVGRQLWHWPPLPCRPAGFLNLLIVCLLRLLYVPAGYKIINVARCWAHETGEEELTLHSWCCMYCHVAAGQQERWEPLRASRPLRLPKKAILHVLAGLQAQLACTRCL